MISKKIFFMGKPFERMGRKASGLSPRELDRIAGLQNK